MQLELKDLGSVLQKLIKDSGKTAAKIAEETNIGAATLSRCMHVSRGMQPQTARKLNRYFKVPYFVGYQNKNGELIPSPKQVNKSANKFNVGDTVMSYYDHEYYMVQQVKYIKYDWHYLLGNDWIAEEYLELAPVVEAKPNIFIEEPMESNIPVESMGSNVPVESNEPTYVDIPEDHPMIQHILTLINKQNDSINSISTTLEYLLSICNSLSEKNDKPTLYTLVNKILNLLGGKHEA